MTTDDEQTAPMPPMDAVRTDGHRPRLAPGNEASSRAKPATVGSQASPTAAYGSGQDADLRDAMDRFLADAVRRCEASRSGHPDDAITDPERLAVVLAETPLANAVDELAAKVAAANGYIDRTEKPGARKRPPGRRLNSAALTSTGVAGLLLSGEAPNLERVRDELVAYLVGPIVSLWWYGILDIDLSLDEGMDSPLTVLCDWDLVVPTAADLESLVGIPSGARHLPRKPFDFEHYPGLAMLRSVRHDLSARSGHLLQFDNRPEVLWWQPLLALSLYQDEVVRVVAGYDIEPGRRVDVRFERVPLVPWTPDGVEDYERVQLGGYVVEREGMPRFSRFLQQLGPYLRAVIDLSTQAPKKRREASERLRRTAEHFIRAAENAWGEGDVFPENNADAVLHYVVALESTLGGTEGDRNDLTRKVSQRAAVLAGIDDDHRVHVEGTVRAAYGARSKYAHGGEPKRVELPELRRVVRDVLLARLVLGDGASGGQELWQIADTALMDHSVLHEGIRAPIVAFWARVDASCA